MQTGVMFIPELASPAIFGDTYTIYDLVYLSLGLVYLSPNICHKKVIETVIVLDSRSNAFPELA